jgi:hypothetical protein
LGEILVTCGAGKEKEEADGWDCVAWVVGYQLAVRVERLRPVKIENIFRN